MQNINKTKKKLQLATETVIKLRDNLSDEQLRVIQGGGTCEASTGSHTQAAC